MDEKEIIKASLAESGDFVRWSVEGLTKEEISTLVKPECNSIAFILWHMTRAEDIWINRVILEVEEIYESSGWREKLGTPAGDSGFRYTVEQLQAWPVPEIDLLMGYAGDVRRKTLEYLDSVPREKLADNISFRGSSSTIGNVLAHLITEIALHAGQLAYLRGLLHGLGSEPDPYWVRARED
jgi:uncharacterized damage-inducible protein DinB